MYIYCFINETEMDNYLVIEQEEKLNLKIGAQINFVTPSKELDVSVKKIEEGQCLEANTLYCVYCK